MHVTHARFLVEGQEVCVAKQVSVSSFKVVAEEISYIGTLGEDFRLRVSEGEKFPVIVYLDDGAEKVAGEAFSYPQTPSRLHVGIWRTYILNTSTGRWET